MRLSNIYLTNRGDYMECVEFNTEEKQKQCIKALEKSNRDVFPLVWFIGNKRISGYLVYYTTKGVSTHNTTRPI